VAKREEPKDIARVMSAMCDGIMARVNAHQVLIELAARSTVPVINGLSDWSHPCQALADVMTLQEHFGSLAGRKLAFIGDGNNVARSLLSASVKLGITFALAAPTATAFYTVSPCRVLDSRETTGPWGGQPLGAQQERTATVVGGTCGIPATAKALSFNLTATDATAVGHIRVYPAGTPRPEISSLNFAAGQTRANNGIVSLGVAGDLAFFSGQASGSVHVVLDVNGYFE